MFNIIVVIIVWLAGLLQSAWLLIAKPWSSANGGWDTDTGRITSSSVGSPFLLFVTRAASFVFALAVVIRQYSLIGLISFKFYTVWSFCLLIVFFGLAAAASWRQQQNGGATVSRKIGGREYAIIALYHVMLTTVMIVDTVTWTVLWPMIKRTTTGKELERMTSLMLCFTSYMQHGGNAVLALIEFALNDIPVHPYMMGWVGLWSILFCSWAIVWHHISGLWLYPFLDWTRPDAAAYYLGLFLGHWLFFSCVIGMQRVKDRLLGASRPVQHGKTQ